MSAVTAELHEEFAPTTQAELARFVRDNAENGQRALYPVGGRTALHYGYPAAIPGVSLSTARLSRVVDYPARDMTVTVEAGIRIDALAELLASEGQQLPIDVPQSNRATLGGVVVTDTNGPRRYGYGTMRDYVIGVSAVDAQGRLFKAGGRVVKNVAGYDLCKLLVGSLGTLAVVTQLTLKLRPRPETAALLWTSFDGFGTIDAVLERLLRSAARPVALEVLNLPAAGQLAAESRRSLPAEGPVLVIGVEGSAVQTDWQVETLKQELSPFGPSGLEVIPDAEADPLRTALTEFQVNSDEPLTFQANLRPSAAMEFAERATQKGVSLQVHAGSGHVIGHLPDHAATVSRADEILTPLRGLARRARGNLVVLGCPAEWKRQIPVFGEPEPAWPLMRRLKSSLDPHNLLNPGRLLDANAAIP